MTSNHGVKIPHEDTHRHTHYMYMVHMRTVTDKNHYVTTPCMLVSNIATACFPHGNWWLLHVVHMQQCPLLRLSFGPPVGAPLGQPFALAGDCYRPLAGQNVAESRYYLRMGCFHCLLELPLLGDFVAVLRCSPLSSQGTPLGVAVEADVVVPAVVDNRPYSLGQVMVPFVVGDIVAVGQVGIVHRSYWEASPWKLAEMTRLILNLEAADQRLAEVGSVRFACWAMALLADAIGIVELAELPWEQQAPGRLVLDGWKFQGLLALATGREAVALHLDLQ